MEYINCGKVKRHFPKLKRTNIADLGNLFQAVYSRIARVCKRDLGVSGGLLSSSSSDNWATFLKARLNCSVPGDIPFYFNEIQVSARKNTPRTEANDNFFLQSIHRVPGGDTVLAVFTTPPNAPAASAVCALSLRRAAEVFSRSPFRAQLGGADANWLPVPQAKTPKPR